MPLGAELGIAQAWMTSPKGAKASRVSGTAGIVDGSMRGTEIEVGIACASIASDSCRKSLFLSSPGTSNRLPFVYPSKERLPMMRTRCRECLFCQVYLNSANLTLMPPSCQRQVRSILVVTGKARTAPGYIVTLTCVYERPSSPSNWKKRRPFGPSFISGRNGDQGGSSCGGT